MKKKENTNTHADFLICQAVIFRMDCLNISEPELASKTGLTLGFVSEIMKGTATIKIEHLTVLTTALEKLEIIMRDDLFEEYFILEGVPIDIVKDAVVSTLGFMDENNNKHSFPIYRESHYNKKFRTDIN